MDTPTPSLETKFPQITGTSSTTPSQSTAEDENLSAASTPSGETPPVMDDEEIASTPSSSSERLPETPFPPMSVSPTDKSESIAPSTSDATVTDIFIPSEPPDSQDVSAPTTTTIIPPPEITSQPEPDMETEFARIIRETVAYAESYAEKGFTFVWDSSLEFSWESGAGWMGTPRVKYEGVDGVIERLKNHIDKIVTTSTDPANGIPAYSANYKVMQVVVDGDIAFVVLYG